MNGGWKACSGCAGDYEDPERSAWEEAEEEQDDEKGLVEEGLVEEE